MDSGPDGVRDVQPDAGSEPQVVPPKRKLFSFEDGSDMFTLNGLGRQVAQRKMKEGKPVQKHANGKVNLASVVDDPSLVPNVCPYCNFTFVHKFVLARHIKQIHEKHKLVNYKCPKCSYNTVRKDQMRSHFSVVHENFRPFSCSMCSFRAPKSFRVSTHLQKAHGGKGVVIHDTEMRPTPVSPPPRPKPVQETQVAQLGSLKEPSEAEYQCCECKFRTFDQMKIGEHVTIVHEKVRMEKGKKEVRSIDRNEAPKCQTCSRRFETNANLLCHMRLSHRTVSNEYHVCHLCSTQFFQEQPYELHMKSLHPNEPRIFRCSICFVGLKSTEFLCLHIKRQHPGADYLSKNLQNRKKAHSESPAEVVHAVDEDGQS